MKIFT
ncbi:uncharacterized protein FFMR_03516 [Fusarium fujikuroi]